MNRLTLISAIAILLTVAGPSWACEAAGPSTHVGKVLTIDDEKMTFTILDAQTVSPVTFEADADILAKVTGGVGTAFVVYDDAGAALVATDVTFR